MKNIDIKNRSRSEWLTLDVARCNRSGASFFQSRWLFYSMHRVAKNSTNDGHSKINMYCMMAITGKEKTSCVRIWQGQDEMFQQPATPLDVQQNKEEEGSDIFTYKLLTLLSLPTALAQDNENLLPNPVQNTSLLVRVVCIVMNSWTCKTHRRLRFMIESFPK
jgi:hypothetical protein